MDFSLFTFPLNIACFSRYLYYKYPTKGTFSLKNAKFFAVKIIPNWQFRDQNPCLTEQRGDESGDGEVLEDTCMSSLTYCRIMG